MTNESIFPADRMTIVGVLNLTPDSFSDGGRFVGPGGVDQAAAVAAGTALARAGAHVAHAALLSLLAQVEAGACCPLTMTYACLPALRNQKDVAAEWEERILGTEYDPRAVPASEKKAVLVVIAMPRT